MGDLGERVKVTRHGYFGAADREVDGRIVRRTKTQLTVRLPAGEFRFRLYGDSYCVMTGGGAWRRRQYSIEAAHV